MGIAGVQTGIYPMETPGGWQLIGRTPLKPFDPDRAEPFLMKAGDAVQFYAIERGESIGLRAAGGIRHELRARDSRRDAHHDPGSRPMGIINRAACR